MKTRRDKEPEAANVSYTCVFVDLWTLKQQTCVQPLLWTFDSINCTWKLSEIFISPDWQHMIDFCCCLAWAPSVWLCSAGFFWCIYTLISTCVDSSCDFQVYLVLHLNTITSLFFRLSWPPDLRGTSRWTTSGDEARACVTIRMLTRPGGSVSSRASRRWSSSGGRS